MLQPQFTDDLILQYAEATRLVAKDANGDESGLTVDKFTPFLDALGIGQEGCNAVVKRAGCDQVDIVETVLKLKRIFSDNDDGRELLGALSTLEDRRLLTPTFLKHILSGNAGLGPAILTEEVREILDQFDQDAPIDKNTLLNTFINAD